MPVPLRTPVLLPAALALAIALPLPAAASAPALIIPAQTREDTPEPLAGLQALLKALDGWMKRFPTYGAPEILPNGDIIIRRHPSPEPPPRKPAPGPDGTET